MSRTLLATLLAALFTLSLLPSVARAQDDPVEDTTSEGAIQVLDWEPMIVEFYADASHGKSAVVTPAKKDAPAGNDVYGEGAGWLALKPLIQPKKGPYGENEPVLSAWQRVVNDDGTVEFVRYAGGAAAADGSKAKRDIHSIFAKDSVVRLLFDLDIKMNRTPSQKDQIVKDYFKVAELTVTAYLVSENPDNYRDALPDDAKGFTLLRMGKPDDMTVGEDFRSYMRRWNATGGTGGLAWDTRQVAGAEKGVYEYRIFLRVLGRGNSQEEFVSKSITGAIRVAQVNDTHLEILQLNKERVGGYGKAKPAGKTGKKNPQPKTTP